MKPSALHKQCALIEKCLVINGWREKSIVSERNLLDKKIKKAFKSFIEKRFNKDRKRLHS